MAYTNRNLLNKIVAIQDIVKSNQKKGITMLWTFKYEIKPVHHISYSTFNNYMGRNAKKELESLDRKEAEKKRQLTLTFD